MYQPPAFKETRQDVLFDMIKAHPLASLVIAAADGIVANHIPMLVEEKGDELVLSAHVSRGNDLREQYQPGSEVLAIFQGAAHYISPSWYPAKQIDGKVVPTYNYVVVHARGTLEFIDDAAWKLSHLNALTDHHEEHRAERWSVSDAPDDFTARQLKGLYGMQLRITSIEGKWKVSQNRAQADQQGVVEGLGAEPNPMAKAMADAVRSRI